MNVVLNSVSVKEMNRQMVSVFNFVVTVGGAFAFGYKAIDYSIPGDTFGLVGTWLSYTGGSKNVWIGHWGNIFCKG